MIASGGLAAAFARARAERRAALIGYVVAGDPDLATTLAVLEAITEAGVDIIELGIPYGDPLADGPTIAAAGQRALQAGIKFADSLALAAQARARGCAPILFFTYVNPVDRYGAERFARDARDAGAVGAIVPDVPLEELDAFAPPLRAAGLAIPQLIAPTTPPTRATRIAAASTGFVYVVSRLGVTGARREPDVAWISGALAAAASGDRPAARGWFRHFHPRTGCCDRIDCGRRSRRKRAGRLVRRLSWYVGGAKGWRVRHLVACGTFCRLAAISGDQGSLRGFRAAQATRSAAGERGASLGASSCLD